MRGAWRGGRRSSCRKVCTFVRKYNPGCKLCTYIQRSMLYICRYTQVNPPPTQGRAGGQRPLRLHLRAPSSVGGSSRVLLTIIQGRVGYYYPPTFQWEPSFSSRWLCKPYFRCGQCHWADCQPPMVSGYQRVQTSWGWWHEYSLCNRPKLVPPAPRLPPHPSSLFCNNHNQQSQRSHQQTQSQILRSQGSSHPLRSVAQTGLMVCAGSGGPQPGFHTCAACGPGETQPAHRSDRCSSSQNRLMPNPHSDISWQTHLMTVISLHIFSGKLTTLSQ